MGTWVEQVHKRASVMHDQIVAAKHAELTSGIILSAMIEMLQEKLRDIYEEEMPLAKIYDNSDLVFHAEGPSTRTESPGLHAFNWLCQSAERRIKVLAKSIFEVTELDAKKLARKIDLRFTGFAPGSIYAGFKLSEIDSPMGIDEPESVYSTLRAAIQNLPAIPEFIEDEFLRKDIVEFIPDPALRDASLEAVFGLSPTGRSGIHTLDISSPAASNASLTTRERIVLREALQRPISDKKKHGSFIGEVRNIDLDSGRFHLRDVTTVGTLRCVVPSLTKEIGKKLLGSTVSVEGEYEVDRSGRPRLLFAHQISEVRESKHQHALEI